MLYGKSLAIVHDAGFTGPAAEAAEEVLARLRAAGLERGLVVELGCGSGVTAARLLAAGYDVLGVEISPDMLDLARRRAPGAGFVCASWSEAAIPPCVAVAAVGEVINYLTPGVAGEHSVAGLFGRAHAALRPGGLLLLDFATPGRCEGGERVSHVVSADYAVLCDSREDPDLRLLTRRIATFLRVGDAYQRADETHRLRLYQPERVRAMLVEAGFDPRPLAGYGPHRFERGHAGFAAVRV